MSRALDYLAEHYREPLTVGSIADAVRVSPGHLAHLFRASTGSTIRDFLAGVRVAVAKRLLTDSDHKLDNVAELSGFCDASHFSRVFRQHVGYPPGEYRRRVTREPDFLSSTGPTHIFFVETSKSVAVGSKKNAGPVIVRRRLPRS